MERTHMRPEAPQQRKERVTVAGQRGKLNLPAHAREWLSASLHPRVRTGASSLDDQPEDWEPGANYVIQSTTSPGAGVSAVTLAQEFLSAGGHVIWVGTTDDLYRISDQLMFKIAGLGLPAEGGAADIGVLAYLDLIDARAQMIKMWIDFCNVEDCGDVDLEREFIASMSSFKPTLIIVADSIFDETALDPFGVLVRQTYGLNMVTQLRETNPMSSVLWPIKVPASALTV
jgi:hypothetical protein